LAEDMYTKNIWDDLSFLYLAEKLIMKIKQHLTCSRSRRHIYLLINNLLKIVFFFTLAAYSSCLSWFRNNNTWVSSKFNFQYV